MRLEEVVKAVGGGYCRLQMPLRRALGVRGTVAGHRLGALEGLPPFQIIPGHTPLPGLHNPPPHGGGGGQPLGFWTPTPPAPQPTVSRRPLGGIGGGGEWHRRTRARDPLPHPGGGGGGGCKPVSQPPSPPSRVWTPQGDPRRTFQASSP